MNKRIKKKSRKRIMKCILKSVPGPCGIHGVPMTVEQIIKHRAMTLFMQKLANQHEGMYHRRNFKRAFKSFYKTTFQTLHGPQKLFRYQRFANRLAVSDPLGPIKEYNGLVVDEEDRS